MEAAIEAGADDVQSGDEGHTIYTQPDELAKVSAAVETKLGEPQESKLAWKPTTTVALGLEEAKSLMNLIDLLEDNDDVQTIHANYEIPDDVAAQLAA